MAHHDESTPQRVATPVPARDGAPPLPTPVRASLGDDQAGVRRAEATRTTVELEVDGTSWTASVGGMSRSGATLASAPTLLLRFDRTGGGDESPREAWVVGRSLADLTDLQVEVAFGRSRPAPEAWERKPLFPEAGSRSGKEG